jgi:hypothetical protein
MKTVVPQHINKIDLKAYYLIFDENGAKISELLDILMDSLLEFVFGINYIDTITPKLHKKFFNACEHLYKDKDKRNPKKEGDLGEIILHTLLRKYMNTIPLLGKLYLSTDKNTSAKGYDVVQILPNENKNILILGESKMYSLAKSGIDDLVGDLRVHFTTDYMRRQFVRIAENSRADDSTIQNKIAAPMKRKIEDWEFALRTAQSLDKVIDELCVPLLCTYTYSEYANHKKISDQFIENFEKEILELDKYFKNKGIQPPACLNVILMLFPVPDKDALIKKYYDRIDAEVQKK